MIQIPLNQVKDDLSRYLRVAEKEDVIITRSKSQVAEGEE